MKKNTLFIAILLMGNFKFFAQKTINNYAYVVVPDQFSFQDSRDQYQLNSLTRFLLEKEGMKVFWDTEKIPREYVIMECAGLKLKMNKKSSMFRSKVNFDLMDCYNNVVFSSEIGSSSEKEFKKGYQESIRNAFKSFAALNYTYVPQPAAEVPVPVVASVAEAEPKLNVPNSKDDLVYKNDNDLILALRKTGGSYVGKVKSSASINYSEGDLICKLFETSLPNVFKTEWKDSYGNFINTIAYFDDNGVLNIDFSAPTGITTMKFVKQ